MLSEAGMAGRPPWGPMGAGGDRLDSWHWLMLRGALKVLMFSTGVQCEWRGGSL